MPTSLAPLPWFLLLCCLDINAAAATVPADKASQGTSTFHRCFFIDADIAAHSSRSGSAHGCTSDITATSLTWPH